MYLKCLEIMGFKSFPDKTIIDFGSGITAIVGPNGSGKSNVADAVRWVLGEQSTRTLRGGKMEDVIFGGTKTRKAQGYAEVSLTIDNRTGILKIAYDEVVVGRRYYRSGESDYFINRKPVRLRDVHELFMDTGLGRDGYSIIGQGRIDEILSLKSADRRDIFEEAAGITKYKYRRDEAQRKLDAAAENLLRLTDIIDTLAERVEPLRKQSEKAREYLLLRDELRGMEIDLFLHRHAKSQKACEKAAGDYHLNLFQLEEAKRVLDSLYRSGERLTELMRACDEKEEELRGFAREKERLLAASESRAAALSTERKNNAENGERYRAELASGEENSRELSETLEGRRREIIEKGREESLARAESDEKRAQAEETAALVAEMERELANLSAVLASLRLADATDRSANEHLLSAINNDEARRAALRSELEEALEGQKKAEEELETLYKSIEQAEAQRSSMQNTLNGYRLRAKTREEKAEKQGAEARKRQNELHALQSRHKLLSDMEKEYEGFNRAVRIVMKQRDGRALEGIHGTVAELIRVKDEYAVAVEVSLGQALQNIVTDSERDAKRAIELLKRQDGGRATFYPLNVIRGNELREQGLEECEGFVGIGSRLVSCDERYGEVLRNLLGRTVVAADMEAAIAIAKRFGYRFRVVTLDGQLVNQGGSMTGGSLSKSTGILSRANELLAIEQNLSELKRAEEEDAEEGKRLARELADTRYQLEVTQAAIRENDDLLLASRSTVETKKELAQSVKERSLRLCAELDRFDEDREKLLAEKAALERQIALRVETVVSEEEKLAALTGTCDRKREEGRALADPAARDSAQTATARAATYTGKQNPDPLERVYENSLRRTGDLERLIGELADHTAALERELAACGEEQAALKTDIEKIGEDIKAQTRERMDYEGQRVQNEKSLREKNEHIVRLEKESERLQNLRESCEAEVKAIADQLWESYELTINEAARAARAVEDEADLSRKIGVLKGKMRAMGEINLSSIEEYTEVKGRYELLLAQKTDAEKASDELSSLIRSITSEMKGIFAENFAKLNEYFQASFVEIFEGGRAELALDDPKDLLGSGIEIRVQLPGKNLKILSLLSGGERAFVAIALYFAILKLRPTPFCVLDEIEAALDDVNVARFARYLKTLTDKTQFIVITHRRGTMEEADILYGVTMQEAGVSKLLSMDLRSFAEETIA